MSMHRTFWRWLKSRLPLARRGPKQPRRRSRWQPLLERLEDRTLLSVLLPSNNPFPGFTDGGGPVIFNADVQLVFWGSAYSRTTTPSQPAVESAVDTLLAGPYTSAVGQYRTGLGRAVRVGSTVITWSNPPAQFSSADVDHFLKTNINNGTLPDPASDPSLLYVVIPQPGSTDPSEGLGGYHAYDFDKNGTKFHFAWTENTGTLDDVTNVFSHELVESITDPEGTAIQVNPRDPADWNEIADNGAQYFSSRVDGVLAQSYYSALNHADVVLGSSGGLVINGGRMTNKNDRIPVAGSPLVVVGLVVTLNGETSSQRHPHGRRQQRPGRRPHQFRRRQRLLAADVAGHDAGCPGAAAGVVRVAK